VGLEMSLDSSGLERLAIVLPEKTPFGLPGAPIYPGDVGFQPKSDRNNGGVCGDN
jgi:hypothetical protein